MAVELTAVYQEVPAGYIAFVIDLVRHVEAHGCALLRDGGNHSVCKSERAANVRDSSTPRSQRVFGAQDLSRPWKFRSRDAEQRVATDQQISECSPSRSTVSVHRAAFALSLLAMLCLVSITPRAQQSPRWELGAEPVLTLGLDDGDSNALLQVIVFATRLPDGSILVGDRGEFALKHFDGSGLFRRAFARKGSGPGEVRYLGQMFRCGDSILTYDIEEGHRMSVFSLGGRYERSFRWRTPPGQSVPYVSACNGAGDFVHVGWPGTGTGRPGIHRARVPVWMSGADSSAPRMLDSVSGSERWGYAAEGRFAGSRPLPLGKQPVVGVGRSRALVGDANRFMVSGYDLARRRIASVERSVVPTAVSQRDIRDEIERAVAKSGESRRAQVERGYAAITFPATVPAYTHLVIDSEDFAWVRPFPRSGAREARWSVFSPSGTFVGEVAIPSHLEVFEIGRDYVLGRFLAPDEAIPQVRLYRSR